MPNQPYNGSTPYWEEEAKKPYKGLNPYSEEDVKRFFGRETQIENIIDRLTTSRLTILYGDSGVGKTSVVRAGVAAQLRQQAQENLTETEDKVPVHGVVVFPPFHRSWKEEPLSQLKEQIKFDIREIAPNIEPPASELPFIKTLQTWTKLLGREEGDGELFIILDQFEEYFLYHHSSKPEEGTFAFEFPRAVTRSRLRVNFLLSIRKDSLAELDYFKGRLLNLLGNRLELGHLDWNSATEAIRQPIYQYFNTEISPEAPFAIEDEERLVKKVLEEVSQKNNHNGCIEAPYLQLVMESLWREEIKEGSHCLRLETLIKLGGSKGIAKRHLNERMEKLSPQEKDLAASIFHYLVTPSGGKKAYSPLDLAELAKQDRERNDRNESEPLTEKELSNWLDKLTQKEFRLLRSVGKRPNLSYEIFHDVLAQPILTWQSQYIRTKQEEIAKQEAKLIEEKAERKARERVKEAEDRASRAEHRTKQLKRLNRTLIVVSTGILIGVGVTWYRAEMVRRIQRIDGAVTQFTKAKEDFESGNAGQLVPLFRVMQLRKELQDPLNDLNKWFIFVKTDRYTSKAKESLQTILKNIQEKNRFQFNSPVLNLRFRPNGNNLAIISTGSVRLLNKNVMEVLGNFKKYEDDVTIARFDSNGKILATAFTDGTIRLFNLQNNQLREINSFKVTETPNSLGRGVSSISFNPNGQYLVTGYTDGTMRRWDLQGNSLPKFEGYPDAEGQRRGAVLSMSFSSDGETFATGFADGTMRLWNLQDNQLTSVEGPRNAEGQRRGAVWSMSFSPDGRTLATGSADGTVRRWDLQGNSLPEFKGHQKEVLSVNFSTDDKTLATGSADGRVFLWDLQEKTSLEDKSLKNKSLDELFEMGCDWLEDYLLTHSEEQKELSKQCPNLSPND